MNRSQEEYRTGLKRFYQRYPEYPREEEVPLGVGAPMIPIGRQSEDGIDDETQ